MRSRLIPPARIAQTRDAEGTAGELVGSLFSSTGSPEIAPTSSWEPRRPSSSFLPFLITSGSAAAGAAVAAASAAGASSALQRNDVRDDRHQAELTSFIEPSIGMSAARML